MTHALVNHFLSVKALVRVAFAVVSLSAGLATMAHAAPSDAQTSAHGGDANGPSLMGGGG